MVDETNNLSPIANADLGRQIISDIEKQYVETPLPESDVSFKPRQVNSFSINNRIQRVWASLWGWTGSALKMLWCDRKGILGIRPYDLSKAEHNYYSGDLAVGAASFDYVPDEQCDYWIIVSDGFPARVEFKDSIGNVIVTAFAESNVYNSVADRQFGFTHIYVTASSVTITAIFGGPLTAYVSAFRF